MKRDEFVAKLCECLEVENAAGINEGTVLFEIPEYDSMSRLSLIALIDEIFGKTLSPSEFAAITTVKSLIQIIGEDKFE